MNFCSRYFAGDGTDARDGSRARSITVVHTRTVVRKGQQYGHASTLSGLSTHIYMFPKNDLGN